MELHLVEKAKKLIRNVPDFPQKGIQFKDITPVLEHPELCFEIAENMAQKFNRDNVDAILSIESRGFFFGTLLSQIFQVPQFIVRKKGKLPYKTISQTYSLEYGQAEVEMHIDSIKPGMKVLIHDDLLATGGTAEAAANLVLRQNAQVAGFSFFIELKDLKGNERLKNFSTNLITFVAF